jgi:Ca-activated chloride channel family protein
MEGNFFYSREMYSDAIGAYLKALEYPNTVPYGEYGLGAVYLALDEGEAALRRFEAAETALNRVASLPPEELLYRIRYNTGVVYFQQGDFSGAALSFRKALEIDGSRIEAKQNLELSLLSMSGPGSVVSAPVTEGEQRGGDTLFDYIHQKEQDQWKSREWAEDAPSPGPDY